MKSIRNSVLIVDDTPENIRVLGEILEREHYDVFIAENGPQALQIAQTNPLDLILLDVMMPQMNGYEVCQHLKADPLTMDVPIIFLTALNSDEDEATGLGLGAVDFITKPFKVELVKTRVETQLSLFSYRKQLEKLVELRTMQLAESFRELTNLDEARKNLLNILFKKLWEPQTGLFAVTETAISRIDPVSPYVGHLRESFETARKELINVINAGLFLGSDVKDSTSHLLPVHLDKLVAQTGADLLQKYRDRQIRLDLTDNQASLVAADLDLLGQVLLTQLEASFLLAEPRSTIRIQTQQEDSAVILRCEVKSPTANHPRVDSLLAPDKTAWADTPLFKLGQSVNMASRIAVALGGRLFTETAATDQLRLGLQLRRYEKKKGVTINL